MDDPRRKNHKFDYSNSESSLQQYSSLLLSSYENVDDESLKQFFEILLKVGQNGNLLFFAGNGGSASIAEHAACDIAKGAFFENKFRIRALSLTSNMALISAVSNDFGYENIFSFQLQTLATNEDVLVLISSSGDSRNIVEAAKTAREIGMKIIGLTGFSGGALRELADISLHVNAQHYGVVEDVHMALIHSVTDRLQRSFDKN